MTFLFGLGVGVMFGALLAIIFTPEPEDFEEDDYGE